MKRREETQENKLPTFHLRPKFKKIYFPWRAAVRVTTFYSVEEAEWTADRAR